MARLVLPAPAKLNLFLHVLGRRADGYHELQTAFDLIDWQDRIILETVASGDISRRGPVPGVATGEPDLCQRAAALLRQAAAVRQGVRITLHKRVPVGAGLGGGSSDAASVLLGLNHLWDCGLPAAELARLGRTLGADVPFFLLGRPAFGQGIGEQLEPISLESRWYLVLVPECAISTAEVFGDPGLTRNSTAITIADLDVDGMRNDCEPVVRRRWPGVARALDWLRNRGAGQARLTGTGSAVFAAFSRREQARAVLAEVPAGVRGRVCRGLDRSPLHGALAAED